MSLYINMKGHAYAQLLRLKLSDCGLWHWQLKAERLTTCIRASFGVEASTQAIELCEILLPIDAPCSDTCPGASQNLITYLPSSWRMLLTGWKHLGGCSLRLTQHVKSSPTLGGEGRSPSRQGAPLQQLLSLSHHLPVPALLFIDHYTELSVQQSTVVPVKPK